MDLEPLKKKDYKKLFKNLGTEKDILHIYLDIYEILFDPEIISDKINQKYYKIEKIGQKIKRGKGYRIAESNSISFKREYENVLYPENEFDQFISEILTPNELYLKDLFKNCHAKIEFVYYYNHSNNIGIYLPNKIIHKLSDFDLSVDFDLYCLHED